MIQKKVLLGELRYCVKTSTNPCYTTTFQNEHSPENNTNNTLMSLYQLFLIMYYNLPGISQLVNQWTLLAVFILGGSLEATAIIAQRSYAFNKKQS